MLLKGMELLPDQVKDELKRTAPQQKEMQSEEIKGKSSGRYKDGKTNSSKELREKSVGISI